VSRQNGDVSGSRLSGAAVSTTEPPGEAEVHAISPPRDELRLVSNGDLASIGQAFIEALSRGDWPGARAMEDPALLAALPASKLQQTAQMLAAQYGAYQSIGSVTTSCQTSGTRGTIAAVPVTFAHATVTLNVSVSAAGQVAGLQVGTVVPASPPAPAAYVEPRSFTETAVTVGSAPWALPGTLTMPNGAGPFPAVVLVQGSGPHDRDETFGLNTPFRDLAWGLASAGIAVLRYDKRTFVYGAQMAADPSITVRQETTDDAMAAIPLLRKTPKVDPTRVFLVGHSLGAYLAPRIAAQVPGQLAGIAMLEAPTLSIPQMMLLQLQYLASLQGSPSPQVEQQLATLKEQVALAESPSLSPSTPASELPLDMPASYLLDLRTYNPLTTAAGLTIPMFFSQGSRDYQVPPSELQPWEQALASHSNVTFRTYPAMDHLLLDGSGPATPAEYSVPGHVDSQLVADLAAWLTSH
jgi:uncharacterized protein